MTLALRASLVASLAALLIGCGGGGSSSADGKSRVKIDWPDQTRGFKGSPLAGSAVIRFSSTTTSATLKEYPVVRPAGTGATSKSYTLPESIAPGTYILSVLFCAGAEADLARTVGLGSVVATVGTDGVLRDGAGKSLGDVAFSSTLTGVTVVPSQTVLVGEKRSLQVTATTQGGGTVSLPFSLVKLTVSSGTALRADDDGTVTGVEPGTSLVVARAFGIDSVPTAVNVTTVP